MSELLLLRFEILLRPVCGAISSGTRSTISRPKPSIATYFAGIVRHQPDLADAEVAEDLGAGAVVADVGREAELRVGLDRVVALLLKLVRLQLVEQADAAPFLQQIEDDAFLLGRDQLEARARVARRNRSGWNERRRR